MCRRPVSSGQQLRETPVSWRRLPINDAVSHDLPHCNAMRRSDLRNIDQSDATSAPRDAGRRQRRRRRPRCTTPSLKRIAVVIAVKNIQCFSMGRQCFHKFRMCTYYTSWNFRTNLGIFNFENKHTFYLVPTYLCGASIICCKNRCCLIATITFTFSFVPIFSGYFYDNLFDQSYLKLFESSLELQRRSPVQ